MGELFVQFDNFMGLFSWNGFQILDLLLLLVDDWFQVADLVFVDLFRLLKGMVGFFDKLLWLVIYPLIELVFFGKAFEKGRNLDSHELFHLFELLREGFAGLGLVFKVDHWKREVLKVGFDSCVFLFVLVDLFELLDEERL